MALNPDYVPLTPLWEVFTDKDLLTFLRDGYAKFFRDTARTVGKPVYKLTGAPPNYTYTQVGFLDTDGSWRVNMNDQGAFSDVLYGYPLDNNGDVDLYFAQFYSDTGIFQFSREGFPNFFNGSVTPSTPIDINFVPNGQFLLHTDIPPDGPLELGEVRSPITQVAFGNWTFERPVSSTARDFVLFDRIGSYVTNPEKSPRYAIRVNSQAPSAGDQFKDLRVKFDDVNKFSSDTQMYTFAITAKALSGGDTPVDLVLIKNFGTGGDAETEINLVTFNITGTFTVFYFAFAFGANAGALIGQNNDDFVQIALRFPTNGLFNIELTDALLTIGDIVLPAFNDTTTKQFIYQSMLDDMVPAYNGYDIGLPLVLTKSGLRYDDSTVGLIYPATFYNLQFGFLTADGAAYDSTLHSADGIPYSRLRDRLTVVLTSGTAPLDFSMTNFGSGSAFVTLYINENKEIEMTTNMAGATAAPTDGAVPTGFTFKNNHIGNTNVDAKGYVSGGFLYIISDIPGVLLPPSIGTVGGTIEFLINGELSRSVTKMTAISIAAGQYFTFWTPTDQYLVWFKVDGAGTMPVVPSTTPIEIDLYSGLSAQNQAAIIADSISGKDVSVITTVAASSIPQSSYFNFSTLSQSYYGWINKDNGGTDPMISGKIGIEIPISSSDTKDQVATKVASAINLRYFATPDLRGIFLKGFDGSGNHDLGHALRYATNSVLYGNSIGSSEYSNNISHDHRLYSDVGATAKFWSFSPTTPVESDLANPFDNGVSPFAYRKDMTFQGSSESRPENIYVNYVIKY